MVAPFNVSDVKLAEMVIVGRLANYRIVRDLDFRKRMLASADLPLSLRKFYRDPKTILMGDYAQFDMLIDEVLVGHATRQISVTWYNSTFGVPEKMAGGPFLVALQRVGSPFPPLRGPSATTVPNARPDLLTILQAPCAAAFIFESTSNQALEVRQTLKAPPR